MIRDYDTMVKALLRCKKGDRCTGCAYVNDDDCSASLASDVLEVLAGHDQIQSHRNTILQTVMGALDKGGYSVTVTPDGEVRMMPWRDTARWIKDAKDNIWHCSACGYHFGLVCQTYKFCPKCGAWMEDDNEDD